MDDEVGDERSQLTQSILGLARQAVESYVRERQIIDPPNEIAAEMQRRAGVFVCLKKQGSLRGCIGTFEPTAKNVAHEIIQNAISSATRDPRFPPVNPEELAHLSYSVDILTPPEPVESTSELDPKTYGIIVQSGMRRGLLLPDLEGVDSVEDQIAIASRKAGISSHDPIRIMRFRVQRYE